MIPRRELYALIAGIALGVLAVAALLIDAYTRAGRIMLAAAILLVTYANVRQRRRYLRARRNGR